MILKLKKNKSKIILLVVLVFTIIVIPQPLIKSDDRRVLPFQEPLPKTAQTQTTTLVPDGDLQTSWITATPHWNKLKECVSESDPPDGVYVVATSDYHGEIEIFSIDDPNQPVGFVSEIKIHTYGASTGDSNPKVSIYWNGDWTEWQTVNLPRNPIPGLPTPDWFVNTFEVEGALSHVYNLKVRYQAQCTGWFYFPPFGFPIGSNNLDAFFCEVTYEISTEITESCRPSNDGDINEWLFYPQPHWSRLNEEVINPHPGDDVGIFANFDYNGDIEEFEMDNSIVYVDTVSKIEVHTYGGSTGDTNPRVRIFWNNIWSAWQTVNLPRQPTPAPPLNGWATNTFTFEGDQFDVNDLRVQYQAQCTGWFYIPPFSFPIGSNSIYTSYCDITYEPGDPLTKLIGSSEKYFPKERNPKLGYTVFGVSAVDPIVRFRVVEEIQFNDDITFKLKIDDELVWSTFLDISSAAEFEIQNIEKLEEIGLTHKIVIELDNVPLYSGSSKYKLEFFEINNYYCYQSILYEEVLYSPVETHIFGGSKDDAVISIACNPPFENEEGVIDSFRPSMFTTIMVNIDPDLDNIPLVYYQYYIHKVELVFKIINPDGSSSSSYWIWPMGIFPSEAEEQGFEDILFIMETIVNLIPLLPLPEYFELLLIPIDVGLSMVDVTPGPHIGQGLDGDSYHTYWETDIDCGPSGFYFPNPKFSDFRMVINWDPELTSYDYGSYQAEISWNIDIWQYYWYTGEYPAPGFTLSGVHYLNWEYSLIT